MIPRFEPTVSFLEPLWFMGNVLTAGGRVGETVTRFEQDFAAYLGGEVEAVFVPSGRMALWLALTALDYPPGSEVIVPAFTYFAIPAMIRYVGLTPVYAEIDEATYELTPRTLEAAMTARTKAVIPTHLFGRTCELEEMRAVCAPRGIDLIEDCAQACGARLDGRRAGTRGRAAYFTFGVTKNFTTFSGGMLTTADRTIAERARQQMQSFTQCGRACLLKEAGKAMAMRIGTRRMIFNASLAWLLRGGKGNTPDFVHVKFEEQLHAISDDVMQSLRWRPGDAQARAGLRQLKTVESKNERRRRHGTALLSALREGGSPGLPSPPPADGDHIFMSFAIRRPQRYRFAAALRSGGVDVSPGYMTNCAAEPALGGAEGNCPVAQRVADTILHLPLYPGLRASDIEQIKRAVLAVDQTRESASARP